MFKVDRGITRGGRGGAWVPEGLSPPPPPHNEITLCTGVYGEPQNWAVVSTGLPTSHYLKQPGQWRHQVGHEGICPPQSEALPLLAPLPVRRKKWSNRPFSANFWVFAPSEMHFAPSMPPTKKKFWCRHWAWRKFSTSFSLLALLRKS